MDAHLRDLRYFVAVAEELNFTRAAQRLHLSQPALSKQIRGLETTLRAQLFRRDRRQVELTTAGAALHAVARSLLQDWDDGVAVVGDAAAQDARVLRVGTLTSIGRGLYPAITDQFAKRHPGWAVELHTYGWGDPTAGLRDRTSDAAFVWLPIDAADVETVVLALERRFVAISARHPLADRQTIEFSEIVDEPAAALPASAGAQRDFWLAIDARDGSTAAGGRRGERRRRKIRDRVIRRGDNPASRGQRRHLLPRGDRLHPGPRPRASPARGRLAARRPKARDPGLRSGLPRRGRHPERNLRTGRSGFTTGTTRQPASPRGPPPPGIPTRRVIRTAEPYRTRPTGITWPQYPGTRTLTEANPPSTVSPHYPRADPASHRGRDSRLATTGMMIAPAIRCAAARVSLVEIGVSAAVTGTASERASSGSAVRR